VLSVPRSPGTSRLVFYNFTYISNLHRIVPHTHTRARARARAHTHTHTPLNLHGTF